MVSKTTTPKCMSGGDVDPEERSTRHVRKDHGEATKPPSRSKAKGPLNPWTTHQSRYEALLRRMTGVANKNGYVVNPDKTRVEKVLGLMAENLVETGMPFCPCRQSDPIDPSKDVTCPCPNREKEIEKDGHCFCRLFYRKPEGRI